MDTFATSVDVYVQLSTICSVGLGHHGKLIAVSELVSRLTGYVVRILCLSIVALRVLACPVSTSSVLFSRIAAGTLTLATPSWCGHSVYCIEKALGEYLYVGNKNGWAECDLV